MTRGFVTVATGKDKYYKLAQTLMLSYKQASAHPLPFALICDRTNEYTEEFDDIVFLPSATCSYLDKIELLKIAPYDETIFIDADSIAFGDLNRYWKCFEGASDISSVGGILPLDSERGWFYKDSIGSYIDKISYIPFLHGGIYFIRKGDLCNKVYETCMEIKENYHNYRFAFFDKPADEPIIALAMAIHNCRPVERKADCFTFVPSDRKAISANYYKKKCFVKTSNPQTSVLLIHYANRFVSLPLYTVAKEMVHFQHRHNRQWNILEGICFRALCYSRFIFIDFFRDGYFKREIKKIYKRFGIQ